MMCLHAGDGELSSISPRERVNFVVIESRACIDEHVLVGVDDVSATRESGIFLTRAIKFFDLSLRFRVGVIVGAGLV
jgi:hypothetical protein